MFKNKIPDTQKEQNRYICKKNVRKISLYIIIILMHANSDNGDCIFDVVAFTVPVPCFCGATPSRRRSCAAGPITRPPRPVNLHPDPVV